ncbi:MAG: alpha/beta fold hydrolase [Verrucomicrobia bacterium]|nr:alpha/beta fold hydrolase [Verrucomicrobiota bacterium]
MKYRAALRIFAYAALPVVAFIAIVFGGPKWLPPMASVNDPFKSVDFSDLPALQHYTAEDGTALAYRVYNPTGATPLGSVVLIHGSAGGGSSMHVLAKGLANAGYAAYAPDIRGHGASGTKGKIKYIGQLEDDLDSFVRTVSPPNPITLAGFSSGGGFVLRFAGSPRQDEFKSYLLLSPYLNEKAPNIRPSSGGWVDVGIPRIITLSILNQFGVRIFNDLPVIRFALRDEEKSLLTPEYSFALATNFGPQRDYEANIRAVHQPCAVLAGKDDESFVTENLEGIFRKQGKDWPVTLLPGIGHIALTLDPRAINAAIDTVRALQSGK